MTVVVLQEETLQSIYIQYWASKIALVVKNPLASAGDGRDKNCWVSGLGKSPGGRAWQPTPVFLPGESRGQRSLVGYSPWGRKELDTTEQAACTCQFVNDQTGLSSKDKLKWVVP